MPSPGCMSLAELHLRHALQIQGGTALHAPLAPLVSHHLDRCDTFLAAVQLSLLQSGSLSAVDGQVHSSSEDAAGAHLGPQSRAAAANGERGAIDREQDDNGGDQVGSQAGAASTGGQHDSAVRYHWTRGLMTQLQGDEEAALLHFEVCEALCVRCF